MRQAWSERLKQWVRPALYKAFSRNKEHFRCPICGYEGPFKDKVIDASRHIVRINSKCPGCASTERHRMMHLVIGELFKDWDPQGKKLLHIAPEDCLKPLLTQHFEVYHTADLLRKDVDFNEDIQKMSFDDGSYDAVLVSRVLTIPPDLEASIRECRRVLQPGGIAIIAEIYKHDEILEFGKMINSRSREMGISALDLYRAHFASVDLFLSDRYDPAFQLTNLMAIDGKPEDRYPETVRVPGKGFMDLVAVCRA